MLHAKSSTVRSGWPTFPMVFVDQKLVVDNKNLRALLNKDGEL
tara:strand:+ start:193 stop:321 length:129 start_codon:yes stop_codon:yes gene_type:complete